MPAEISFRNYRFEFQVHARFRFDPATMREPTTPVVPSHRCHPARAGVKSLRDRKRSSLKSGGVKVRRALKRVHNAGIDTLWDSEVAQNPLQIFHIERLGQMDIKT